MDGTLDGTEIPVSGTKPSSGNLTYENNVLKEGCLVFDEYKVIFEDGKVKETSKGNCEELSPTSCYREEDYYSPTSWFTFHGDTGQMTGFSDEWYNVPEENQRKRNIVIPCTRTVNGKEIPITEIRGDAFHGETLDNLIITDNITATTDVAFCGITVNKVIFGKSIDLVTNGTFQPLSNVTPRDSSKIGTLIFTNGPREISENSFVLAHINTIVFEKNIDRIVQAFGSSSIGNIMFFDGIREITNAAFTDTKINNLVFNKNPQILTNNAFARSQIKNIDFKNKKGTIDNGETIIFDEGTEIINNAAFLGTSYKKVMLPNGLRTFGYWAFSNSSLEEIYFPNSIEDISLTSPNSYPNLDFPYSNLKTIHYSGNKTFDWATILGGTKKSDDGNGTIVIERTGYTDVTITKD